MKNILAVLLVIFLFHSSAYAADKIRIAIPEPNAAYMTYPLAYKKGFLTNQGVAAEVILMSGRLGMPALNNGVRACTNTGVEAMLNRGKTMKRLALLFFVALLPFTGYSSAQESVEGKAQSIKRKIEEVISGYLTELNGKYKFGSPA
jgi:hypothetical protein